MEGSNPPGMWLNLAHLLTPKKGKPGKSILETAFMQRPQPHQFLLIRRYHQLSADLVRHVLFLAKGRHLPNPQDAQSRLDRTRLIEEPRVQNAAIVGALMPAEAGLLL
jgi:hypothetical protein